jgi:hypothetical protein
MIRRATLKDIDDIVILAVEFFRPFLEKHGVPVIDTDIRTIAHMAIINNQVLVVEHDNLVQGVTAWAIVPHPANHKLKIFYETIWCVRSRFKTDTLSLLRALENEAKDAKADLMLMANLESEHEVQLRRIFHKRGFDFLESHYSKTVRR